MPAFLTHLLAANDSFQSLSTTDKDSLSYHFPAYLWGSLGPDLFYFHQFWSSRSPLQAYGDTLHNYKPQELFAAMGRYVAGHRGAPEHSLLVAYQAGFISHYHLDSITHPYIYSYAELYAGISADRVRGGSHHRTEADISTALYRLKTGQSVHSFAPRQRLTYTPDMAMAIALLLRQMLQEVYGIMVPPEPIVDAFGDTLNCQIILHDPTGIFFRPAAALIDLFRSGSTPFASHICQDNVNYDILNQAHREWFRCDDRSDSSHADFMTLYNQGVAATTEAIGEALGAARSGAVFAPPYTRLFIEGAPPAER